MSVDEDLRRLRRRYEETKDESDAEALVRALARSGKLDLIEVVGRLKRLEDAFALLLDGLGDVYAALIAARTAARSFSNAEPVSPSEVLAWIDRKKVVAPPPEPRRTHKAGDEVRGPFGIPNEDHHGRSRGVTPSYGTLMFDEESGAVPILGPDGKIRNFRAEDITLVRAGDERVREMMLRDRADGTPSEARDLARRQLRAFLISVGREVQ